MNSKGHLITSITKSLVRITGCCMTMVAAANTPFKTPIYVFAIAFTISEVLGIIEELVDMRK